MEPQKKIKFSCLKLGGFFRANTSLKSKDWQRSDPSRLKKDTIYCLSTLCSILSTVIFLLTTSCESNKEETTSVNVSLEERVWLTQFFKDIMLSEQAIYTMWGSFKPMTLIAIEIYTDEEKKAFYDALTEEEKNEGYLQVDYSLDKTWFQWEKIQDRFPRHRFMFFKVDQLQQDHVIFVAFIDVLKTASVIQDNYEAFREAMGFDFHPLELTLQMNQKDSLFWENLNAYLYGLLFGFGKINAQLFHWQYSDHPLSCEKYCEKIVSFSSNELIRGCYKCSIDQFQIPGFKIYNEIDPVVDNFKKEREQIKEIYKGKDFLDLTLQKLTE